MSVSCSTVTGMLSVQEVAGAPGETLQQHRSSAGVYVGCMYSEFLDSVLKPLVRQHVIFLLQRFLCCKYCFVRIV